MTAIKKSVFSISSVMVEKMLFEEHEKESNEKASFSLSKSRSGFIFRQLVRNKAFVKSCMFRTYHNKITFQRTL
jgi:hypothetical protein